ncbi:MULTISPECIES: M23 family metallopeptidase [Staphylococcus]|uniref:M23 family metallopeptidase n=1 Tax=Staphylococcus TaxID=1279 RepID=UPI0015E5AB71|nr:MULTISPECIES: M23 family metallopeptidase [Staphylococcus]MBA1353133.1 peptidoglycan DD-metalloendopeptidase family protein [Staphylococcus cohnii]MBA1389865.1 peptidoglycan DD-metalloendopeptidase family protein [Staphylococcus cohnii]
MKKMVTATIATLSLGAIGVAQGEAHASENNQSNTQYTSNHANSDIFNYGYIDQADNGNYHHTLDGNWDQSMFDQQQYYFYLIDNEGNYHYYYFPMNNQSANTSNVENVNASDDNNYTDDQSHEEVQSEGYDINQPSQNNDVDNSATTNQSTESEQTAQSNSNNVNNTANNAQNNVENNTQNNASTNNNYETNYTQNNGTNDVQQNATSSNDSTPQQQAAPQQNNTQSEAASNSSSNNSTHSSNWLTKNRQLQPYGSYHGGGAHYGVDYAMDENTPVYSLADGTVIQSGWSNYGGGNQVTIQEKNSDNYQWYMHMNSLNVKSGQEVKEGQQIGLSGSTGNSTAPHLHFQRMSGGVGNGYSVDPTSYVNSKS